MVLKTYDTRRHIDHRQRQRVISVNKYSRKILVWKLNNVKYYDCIRTTACDGIVTADRGTHNFFDKHIPNLYSYIHHSHCLLRQTIKGVTHRIKMKRSSNMMTINLPTINLKGISITYCHLFPVDWFSLTFSFFLILDN